MKTKGRVLLLIFILSFVFVVLVWKELSNSLKNNSFSISSSFFDSKRKTIDEHNQEKVDELEKEFELFGKRNKNGQAENDIELGLFRQHNENEVIRNVKIEKIQKEVPTENENSMKKVIARELRNLENEEKKYAENQIKVSESNKDKRTQKLNQNPAVYQNISENSNNENLTLCSYGGEKLVGQLIVDQTVPESLKELEEKLSIQNGGHVRKGGWYTPSHCKARVKVAVIIPYRNRFEQLKVFLRYMHPFLQRQELMYRIIVVEQLGKDPFNRAGLFNIGYKEALKLHSDFECFVFTDVDLLPEDDRNFYGCPSSPLHMSIAVDKFNYRLPFATIFGGCGAFKKADFEAINGMSNLFFGWGGEDDDLYKRITEKGFKLSRPSIQIGRYTMFASHHHASQGNPMRLSLLETSKERMVFDGLNTLIYDQGGVIELPLVTFIKVYMKKSMYSL